jgi:methyl-accepting chemotaxis protein
VRGILSDIQKATSNAVLAAERGGKAVEAGVSQSARAGESIHALTENIAHAAQAATQIAATSQQQYVGVDQVTLAMENIKAASTQTVVSTRQAEAAAQQIHDLGQNLKLIVDRFKI